MVILSGPTFFFIEFERSNNKWDKQIKLYCNNYTFLPETVFLQCPLQTPQQRQQKLHRRSGGRAYPYWNKPGWLCVPEAALAPSPWQPRSVSVKAEVVAVLGDDTTSGSVVAVRTSSQLVWLYRRGELFNCCIGLCGLILFCTYLCV